MKTMNRCNYALALLSLCAGLAMPVPDAQAVQVLKEGESHNKHKICLEREAMSPDMQTLFYVELSGVHPRITQIPLTDLLNVKLSEISISLVNEARLERFLLNVYESLHEIYAPAGQKSVEDFRLHDGEISTPEDLKAVSEACTKDKTLLSCVRAYNLYYTQAFEKVNDRKVCRKEPKS